MKKIISTVLALAMVLSMGVMSFAVSDATAGDFFIIDNEGDLYNEGSNPDPLTPDTTYYIYIEDYDTATRDEAPSRVKIDYEAYDAETDKKVSIVSSSNLSVTKKKYEGEYRYFAVLKLKSLSTKDYNEKEVYLEIADAVIDYKGDRTEPEKLDIDGTYSIEYEEATSEIGPNTVLVSLDHDSDEFDIVDKHGDETGATLYVDSENVETNMLISCDTSYDSAMGDKYMNANLAFYYFSDGEARRPMTLTIPKEGYNFVYEKTSKGLVDVTKTEGKNFVIKEYKMGDYVLSDTALSSVAPTTPVVPPVTPGTQGPTGGNVPFNPGTGAAL